MSTTVGPAGNTRFSTRRCGRSFTTSYTGRFHRYTVPLCNRSSGSRGVRPAANSATGSSSDSSGSSEGKYRTFSSNRSKIEVIHRSPNHTRGRTPWALSSSGRVSVAWANNSMRVSAHSSWPKKYGELAPRASCGPASTCAAFQLLANSDGDT